MSTLKKVRKTSYTKVSNICFFDKRLSFKDVGMYCSMLSLPDNWEWSLRGLEKLHKDGKESIRTSVNHLLELGYITRQQTKDEKGQYSHTQYLIYDDPQDNPAFSMEGVEMIEETLPQLENITPEDKAEKDPWSENRNTVEDDDFEPWCENRNTDEEVILSPWSENWNTDENPCHTDPRSENTTAENPTAENQPQYITYEYKQYGINEVKINEEEEDVSHARVDVPLFKRKLLNSYLCARLMKQDHSREAAEMDKALNAVLNTIREITEPEIIDAINHCSSEDAGNLWYRIYREMFSTDLGGVFRDKISDKRAYIRKLISNELTLSAGGENLGTILLSASGGY